MLIDTQYIKISSVTKTTQKIKRWRYELAELLYTIKTKLMFELQCNKAKMLIVITRVTTKKKNTEKEEEHNQNSKLEKKSH